MSVDRMAGHDEAIEEAKEVVRKYLPLLSCGEDCRICDVVRKRRRRILAALERLREFRL